MFKSKGRPGVVAAVTLLACLIVGSLAALPHPASAAGNYRSYADSSIAALYNWYNNSTGQFETTT